MYLGYTITAYSTSYFIPTILQELGWASLRAPYMSIPISITAFVISVIVGIIADATRHRIAFATTPLLFCNIGYGILLQQETVTVSVRYMAHLLHCLWKLYGAAYHQ